MSNNSSRESLPVSLRITDVEKKRGLSKHYVYIIEVTCRDGSRYSIQRRYKQFNELHGNLEKRFPVEAGTFHVKDRLLPQLTEKIYLGRSAVRDVTDKRLPLLNSYVKTLVGLPDNIRYDSIVMTFLRPTAEDTASSGHGYSSGANSTHPKRPPPPRVKVDKTSSSNLPPRPSLPPPPSSGGPRAKALYPYEGQYSDELSFSAGQVLSLKNKVDSEWYDCALGGKVGLVPANYLEIIQPLPGDVAGVEDSDEWDDDEDMGKIIYVYKGKERTVEVGSDVIENPSLSALRQCISEDLRLPTEDFVLNYQDSAGDLIEIVDQDDLKLMQRDGVGRRTQGPSPGGNQQNLLQCSPWTLHISRTGDYSVYNNGHR